MTTDFVAKFEFLKYEKLLVSQILYTSLKYVKVIHFIHNQELHITLRVISKILEFTELLKDSIAFGLLQLLDITAIDRVKTQNSYELIYVFLNSFKNLRIHLHGLLSPLNLNSISLFSLYSSANWLEREVWDMFGIFFLNNIDLRRLLTDYGFNGYPLRKSFPLVGYLQVRYDESAKKVVLEPIKLVQDFRYFEYNYVWVKSN